MPVVADTSTRPSLTLVPPDEDFADEGDTLAPEPDPEPFVDEPVADESTAREQEIEARIEELEAADVPRQQSLIEIRDNELAQLRQELAQIRGEVYEPVLDDPFADGVDDEIMDDADAELVCALADVVGEYAVQPDRRQQKRDRCEEGQRQYYDPEVGQPAVEDRCHAGGSSEENVWILLLQEVIDGSHQ